MSFAETHGIVPFQNAGFAFDGVPPDWISASCSKVVGRIMPQLETETVVLYDIPHDRTRTKVSDKCLDFGLVRFQYSAFHGRLTKNRREELALVLEHLVEVHGGSIALIPVCLTDCQQWINVYIEPPPIEKPYLKLVSETSNDNPSTGPAK